MSNLFSDLLNQFATGDTVKDYKHATKLFVDSLYRLSPKYSFLFHVFIDVNPSAAAGTAIPFDYNSNIELGMLAKNAQLPKFSIKNKVLNAYNRKSIVQDQITYEPITITFHDDSADIVTKFWANYYSFYYRDSDYQESVYTQQHKYVPRPTQYWGFTPTVGVPYINRIRIYSLHQKHFTSYTLINPLITSFRHGEHGSGTNDVLQHEMTVAYESVLYATGPVSSSTVQGFNVIHYDNSASPLSAMGGGTQSILGPGGLLSGAGSVINNLGNGNLIGAAITAARMTTNIQKMNIGQTAGAELSTIVRNSVSGTNQQSIIFAPTSTSISNSLTTPSINNNGTTLPSINNQGR